MHDSGLRIQTQRIMGEQYAAEQPHSSTQTEIVDRELHIDIKAQILDMMTLVLDQPVQPVCAR